MKKDDCWFFAGDELNSADPGVESENLSIQ
jgi:hypothetical protein